jgi:hypothetical protein
MTKNRLTGHHHHHLSFRILTTTNFLSIGKIFNYLKRDKSEMAQTLGEALCATRELLVTGDLPVDFKLKSLKTCGEPLCLLRLHAMMTALPLMVQRQKAVLS